MPIRTHCTSTRALTTSGEDHENSGDFLQAAQREGELCDPREAEQQRQHVTVAAITARRTNNQQSVIGVIGANAKEHKSTPRANPKPIASQVPNQKQATSQSQARGKLKPTG